MIQDFSGKTALVTGAASGIGFAVAKALAAEGVKVAIADIDEARVAEAADSIGDGAIAIRLDITDRGEWARTVAIVEDRLGPIDLLCNNAGVVSTPGPAVDVDPAAWDWVINTNLTGTFNGINAVVPRMIANGRGGHIVNTASIQGLVASPGFLAYNAAKFGILGLSETLQIELSQHGIGVSVLCPGATRTSFFAHSQAIAPELAQAPGNPRAIMGNYLTPDDVAVQVISAVRDGHFYIVTHPEYRTLINARLGAIAASVDRPVDEAKASALNDVEAPALSTYLALGGVAKR